MLKAALIDTDILSLFFRGDLKVVKHFEAYLRKHEKIAFTILSYYEIVSGLKHRDARKQLGSFLEFARRSIVLPLNENTVTVSAEIYADLHKVGQPLDDVDILIAGIAKANDLILVTHNQKHFAKISGLELEDWTHP